MVARRVLFSCNHPLSQLLEMVHWPMCLNDFENNFCNSDYLIKRAILCTTNKTVDSINKQILTKMPKNKTILHSKNTPVDEGQAALYPVEFLNEYRRPTSSNYRAHRKDKLYSFHV